MATRRGLPTIKESPTGAGTEGFFGSTTGGNPIRSGWVDFVHWFSFQVECVRLDRLPLGKGARAPRQGGTLRTGQSGFVGGA